MDKKFNFAKESFEEILDNNTIKVLKNSILINWFKNNAYNDGFNEIPKFGLQLEETRINDAITNISKLINEIMDSKIFKENLFKINNSHPKSIRECKECKKIISILVNEREQLKEFECNCDNDELFEQEIFDSKKNLIIINWIITLSVWTKELYNVYNSLNDLLNGDFKNENNSISKFAKIMYQAKVLFEDIFMFQDSIKTSLFYLNDNRVTSECEVNYLYHNSKNKKIKKIQGSEKNKRKNNEGIIEDLIELLEKLPNNGQLENLIDKYNFITIINDTNKSWVKNFRNKIQHNFILLNITDKLNFELLLLQKILFNSKILIVDNFIFLRIVLELLGEL